MNAAKSLDAPHTLRSIEAMLGLGRHVVAGLIDAGFVSPSRGRRNEYRFTFQDVVLLRTAYELKSANIATRKIVRSLQSLKASLPDELPLSGLRITAVGNDIAVREGTTQWEAESGQLLIDFDVAAVAGGIAVLPRKSEPAPMGSRDFFARAEQDESHDKTRAEAAYREALALTPGYIDAYLNLGALLCEAGRCDEAVVLYDEALRHGPEEPLLHFNRAIALEDIERLDDSLASYRRCLQLDPDFADAHFNAARLHEQLGDPQRALRHFNSYRRLQK